MNTVNDVFQFLDGLAPVRLKMDFDNVGKEKTAIFLIIPSARQTYKVIANIFYSQLFERLMLVANNDCNGRLPQLVSCELDEFANIGKIPNFSETLAVVRSHNIRICIVLQGLSQLKAPYEKTWESIIGNCSIFTFLGTNDMDSKEYVSKKLGKTTVRVDSRSYNRGSQGGGSDSENYIQRDLLSPDEISQAVRAKGKSKRYGGNCIIFVDEFKPFYLLKYDTLHHPLFSQSGSSYESGIPNNTDISKSYSEIYSKHKANHTQKLTDFIAIAEEEKAKAFAEHELDEAEKEALEQAELEKSVVDEDLIKMKQETEQASVEEVNPVLSKFINNNETTDEEKAEEYADNSTENDNSDDNEPEDIDESEFEKGIDDDIPSFDFDEEDD